jgi:hypothetical protein
LHADCAGGVVVDVGAVAALHSPAGVTHT